jgi:upstream activation factor subunit UAF30
MPRVKKSENAPQSAEVVENVAVATSPAPATPAPRNVKSRAVKTEPVADVSSAPASAPAPRSRKSASASATSTPAVVASESAPLAESSASEQEVVSDEGLTAAFSEAFAKLHHVSTLLSALKTEFRQLEKRANRELRVANKASLRRKRKNGNRSPSGFVKPTLISDELASFLGKTSGTEMARTEVTREINAYIRKHNLQDKENGRKINPDSNLSKLLKLNGSDELTYFNLQRYMSPHFAKAPKSEAK